MDGKSTQSHSGLRPIKRVITTHDPSNGRAIVMQAEDLMWEQPSSRGAIFALAYATSQFPVRLQNDIDLETHEKTAASGTLGLANLNGTVCRFVDFKPNREAVMHRTKSLDYGVVLQGRIDMVLDSGEVCNLSPGDVVIQRATSHGWRNPSPMEWARMMFVLQDCMPDPRYYPADDNAPSSDSIDDVINNGVGEEKDHVNWTS